MEPGSFAIRKGDFFRWYMCICGLGRTFDKGFLLGLLGL